jgi:hypothetical protein
MVRKINLFLLVISFLYTQCRPARMALQNERWPAKEEYVVEGKKGIFSKERLRFGEFYTTQVNRSWTKGTSEKFGKGNDYTNIISVDYIKRKQTVHFSLSDEAKRTSEVFAWPASTPARCRLAIAQTASSTLELI